MPAFLRRASHDRSVAETVESPLAQVNRPDELNPIDVGNILDEGAWGRYQQLVVLLSALVIIIDGIDNQLLGIAIPAVMKDWAVARGAFAPILAAGFVGMMVGGATAGLVGDRLGRRVALVGSVTVFGLATIGAAMAPNLVALGVSRFFAGVGLQGATPIAAALVSEYAPLRRRPFAVTLIIVCFPLGATAAGLIAIPVLPGLGWRALFLIGGISALVVTGILIRFLPESPRYLVRRMGRWPELARVLCRMGHQVSSTAAFVDSREKPAERTEIRAVVNPEIRFDTFALWAAFFFCLLAVYSGASWIPSVLAGAGLSTTVANTGIAAFNLGGVVGAICGALAMGRWGSRRTMLSMAVGAAVAATVMTIMTITPAGAELRIVGMLGITGGLINAVQTTMYALATHIYQSNVRATGVGTASSVGRLGAILSPYAGNWAIERGGSRLFFALLGTTMMMVCAALGLIRRHIPATGRGDAATRVSGTGR